MRDAMAVSWFAAPVLGGLIALVGLTPLSATAASCPVHGVASAPVAEFSAFAGLERLEVRGGRPGPGDWEWGLGINTQQSGSFVSQSLDWISGHPFAWALSYDGAGNGTITVFDGSKQLFSRTYTSSAGPGLRVGNALRLSVKASPGSGVATVAVTLTSVNGSPASISLSTPGKDQFFEQAAVVVYGASPRAFSATGTVKLTFPGKMPPQGSRLNFFVNAGSVPCDGGAGPAPIVSSPTPGNGAVLAADALPTIGATFQDNGGGVDPTSARLLIDGTDVTAGATVSAGGISFTPTVPLVEGAHTVVASVRNATGQQASLTWSFVTRSPPEIVEVSPSAVATTRRRPTLRAQFIDVGSGIDPALTQLTLDGADVSALATRTEDSLTFSPQTDLPIGERSATVRVADRAGNVTSRSWRFSVIEFPLVPPAPGLLGSIEPSVVVLPLP